MVDVFAKTKFNVVFLSYERVVIMQKVGDNIALNYTLLNS